MTVATLKKYSIEGKQVGTHEISDDFVNAEANGQMIKDYLVAIRKNARQWSANTRTRSEVKHTTRKPRPQKGSGRARQGSLVTPQFRGGGVVFGPKPKIDQHVRINRKERKAAIRRLLAEKIQANRFIVLETTEMEQPKTKTIASFMKGIDLTGRTLFLGESKFDEVEVDSKKKTITVGSGQHANFKKSLSNIPKTEFQLAQNISGYDVAVAGNIVVTEPALNELIEWLTK